MVPAKWYRSDAYCADKPLFSFCGRGQYWGNMGFFNIVMGKNALGIEMEIAWATPGAFTIENFPCNEDGSNCQTDGSGMQALVYEDPSKDPERIKAKRHLWA
jgi:hypothetical protein